SRSSPSSFSAPRDPGSTTRETADDYRILLRTHLCDGREPTRRRNAERTPPQSQAQDLADRDLVRRADRADRDRALPAGLAAPVYVQAQLRVRAEHGAAAEQPHAGELRQCLRGHRRCADAAVLTELPDPP